MSWITNLFKKKPKRFPARDAIGRFLADDNGNILYTDSPAELIEKAKAKALKRDKELLNRINTLHELTTTKTCACGGDCKCASKKPAVKKPVAKKTASKTVKAPVAN
ncbi:MAG: hypothetical protein EBU08_16460, partial [Micrococcales bacterium]|nr:hypothetical protein [Micrococcales bacterium]